MSLLDQILPAAPERKWSNFQRDIFDAVRTNDHRDVLIQAVAGSGKSTTLVEATNHASGSTLLLAFNKAIVEELRGRVYGEVKTFNALGHALWRNNRPGAKIEFKKIELILRSIMSEDEFKEFGYIAGRIIGLVKNNAFDISVDLTAENLIELIDSYQMEIPFDRLGRIAEIVEFAFITSVADTETFDFDDQLFKPVHEGWEFPRFDNVFVDECQDLSPIQHLMLERLQERGARIVAVGDRHQAIYGFRGAMTDSMDVLKRKFRMLELPLSVTYRCSQKVVMEARRFCPTIEWREGAPLGHVGWASNPENPEDAEGDPEIFRNTMIVCRNNAPLFGAILRHVRAKEPCQVMSSFLDSFQGFIKRFKTQTTAQLQGKLDAWYERERNAAEESGFQGKVYALKDKYETISLLCKEFKFTADMIEMVKGLGQSKSGPIFSTIHKAKGLEHENVFILRPDLMPAIYARGEDALRQEDNMQYVAITRAKQSLTYGEGRS